MLWVYGVSLVVVLSTLAFLSIVAYRRFLRRERMMAEALARQRGSEDNTVIIQFCGALDRCAVSEDDVRQWLVETSGKLESAISEHEGEEPDVCTICLEEFLDDKTEVFVSPSCSHIFHVDCISKWICSGKKTECPLCTVPFTSADGGHLYYHRPSNSRTYLIV
uniref:RING-type domain-containing protein n=1 Tax=Rhodosorus marinus TaxID=101924 RepID=A0A7S2Z9E5_9RHOD|mmetsp:Transcript_10766/g.44868  ORF Transcript_10766/g.44868 Transcript_10766/m.44868 type:complete len:164 (+) Transcript_10766:181-672(+)